MSTCDPSVVEPATRARGTRIALVIPAFRAERHIADVIRGIPGFVRHIVIVDDCSPDRTAAAALEVGDPRVEVVRLEQNLGVGGATLEGYRRALQKGAGVIVKMDADDQMDPAYLPALIGPVLRGAADYCKGNRFMHSKELQSMPLPRRLGNLGLSFLSKLASGYWGVFDPTNGYTAIHGAVAAQLDHQRLPRRYFFETGLLIELGVLRAVVRDVPVPARYGNEDSHLSEWRSLVSFPPRLIRGFLWRVWTQHVMRDFGLFSLFLLAGLMLAGYGVVSGAYLWWRAATGGVPTPTGTIMIVVVTLTLGVQFLLQAVSLDVQSVPRVPIHHDLDLAEGERVLVTELAESGSHV